MITPGTTLENPVTGERFTFIETAASTDGERLTFDLALRPGGAVPIPHVHPIQTERFEMLSGTMRFRVGLRHVTATAGDLVEIAPGVVHGFANAGDDEVRVRVTCTPALKMEEMFAEVVAMAEAGRMGRRGMPRNLLDLALLARTYDAEAHAPILGRRLQRVVLAPLVMLARRRAGSPAQTDDEDHQERGGAGDDHRRRSDRDGEPAQERESHHQGEREHREEHLAPPSVVTRQSVRAGNSLATGSERSVSRACAEMHGSSFNTASLTHPTPYAIPTTINARPRASPSPELRGELWRAAFAPRRGSRRPGSGHRAFA